MNPDTVLETDGSSRLAPLVLEPQQGDLTQSNRIRARKLNDERVIEITKSTLLGATSVNITGQTPRVIRQPASKLRRPTISSDSKW